MLTGFNVFMAEVEREGEDHGRVFVLSTILPWNFMTPGLKRTDFSHLTRSSWVHVTRNPTAFLRKQVSRMRRKMSHQKKVSWFVAETEKFGTSVVSFPAEAD